MTEMKQFLHPVIGFIAGGALGFVIYKFIGCNSGT